MASATEAHDDIHQQLCEAICLLALITSRPPNFDELFPGDGNNGTESTALTETDDKEDDEEDDLDDGLGNPKVGGNGEGETQVDLVVLRNKVLDRLAEILARYKSVPGTLKKLDPKHVASVVMVEYKQQRKVLILCSKNEGLDQEPGTEDTDFLESWRTCMEQISRAGHATEYDKAKMLNLIITYQKSRLLFYTEKLGNSFQINPLPKIEKTNELPLLTEAWLSKLPNLGHRIWIDDFGNNYDFLTDGSEEENGGSNAALSARTVNEIEDKAKDIFCLVKGLSTLQPEQWDKPVTGQAALLNRLLPSLFDIWKDARFHKSFDSCLNIHFGPLNKVEVRDRRKKELMSTLRFLCRTYYAVDTFVEAAERLSTFKSIECTPIHVRSSKSNRVASSAQPRPQTPIKSMKSLGLDVQSALWQTDLKQKANVKRFKKLINEEPHIHAEIQLLSFLDTSGPCKESGAAVHPYIGCSKYCCLLCWLLIRSQGAFKTRGCHQTVFHRWELPAAACLVSYSSAFQLITRTFFENVKRVLQYLLNQSLPLEHPGYLSQSSAALSTVKNAIEQETAQMERTELDMRRSMMMPMVVDDGLLIYDNYEKPGYVIVAGGSIKESFKEMTIRDAELYKENHIRTKLGMERSDEMPAREAETKRTCRTCRSRSGLRCSVCRTRYCSVSCQKKDWTRHLFVCRVEKRPSWVDHLKSFVTQWYRAGNNEMKHEQILSALYSDNDLCKIFGFNFCFDCTDIANLMCFYRHMIQKFGPKSQQQVLGESCNLGNIMAIFAELSIDSSSKDSYHDCGCLVWFLERHSGGGLVIPNWDQDDIYQIRGMRYAEHTLGLESRDEFVNPLTMPEKEVLQLYSRLLRDFNNIPDSLSSRWFEFGFCFCRNRDERLRLRGLYLDLLNSGAPLQNIAQAYESKSMSTLMKSKGLNISFFEKRGISFHEPDSEEIGIYRLVAEVTHTLSGRFCYCFQPKVHCYRNCHPKFETHLSSESDGDYGFHGTNTWERWQLLNFYKYVFKSPYFDPKKMQEARRDADPKKLELYLDSLVPDFQKKIRNTLLGDIMHPKLRNRIEYPHGRPRCRCVVHDTIAPEGLECMTPGRLARFETDRKNEEETDEQAHNTE